MHRTTPHTPGPWVWNGNSLQPAVKDPEHSAVHTILQAEGGCGFLMSKTADTLAELDADRAVIALAPRVLEALQALRDAACVALEGSAVLAYADLVLAQALPATPAEWVQQ